MRYLPRDVYDCFPCSYVAVGCAYENTNGKAFNLPLQDGLKDDGYFTLDNMNKFIRGIFSVKKKVYYKRNERMILSEFLKTNTENCIVCLLGHYIFVSEKDYWSFFDNVNDDVVCVWYLKD